MWNEIKNHGSCWRSTGLTCLLLAGAIWHFSHFAAMAGSSARGFTTTKAQEKLLLDKLYVEERGQGDPVLLLHGFGASVYSWRLLAPELAKNNHVIALDMKGFGRSPKPLDDKYSVFDQAELIARFIERRNLRNLTIIGHSFGGGVALALVLKHKQAGTNRISKLVLIDSIAYPQSLPFGMNLIRSPFLAKLGTALLQPELFVKVALRYGYYNKQLIPPRSVIEYARPLHMPGGIHAVMRTAAQIIPENIDALTRQYKTIKQPTLVLWCAHDKVIPLAIARRLLGDLPNSKGLVIPACGHIPHEERPIETAKHIKLFLKAH